MMKTLIWSAVTAATAALAYMAWKKRGLRWEAKGRLGRVRIHANASRRVRRRLAGARA